MSNCFAIIKFFWYNYNGDDNGKEKEIKYK